MKMFQLERKGKFSIFFEKESGRKELSDFQQIDAGIRVQPFKLDKKRRK